MKHLPPARRAIAIVAACLAAAVAAPALAQPTGGIVVEDVDCIPNNDNGLVTATVPSVPAGAEVRLYFRWDEHGPFYYVAMAAEAAQRWWATPPKPTDANHQVEYYVATVGPGGETVAESERLLTPVTEDCDVELTRKERGMAQNLIVGETAEEQMNEEVVGFLCDGIISRMGPDGVLRADSICRRCIIAWWDRREALLPVAGFLGGVTTVIEASPSRP